MVGLKLRWGAVALAAAALAGGAAHAVPFQTGFTTGGNWNHLYAQGFSPIVRADPDPFVDPMIEDLEEIVRLNRFRFFKSGYEEEVPDPENPEQTILVPLVATDFKLAIVDNYFLDLSTFTTASAELIGLSTNTIATTASYATNDPMDFLFDDLELSYGAFDYAAIFVHDDGAGNLSVVDTPVNIVNYLETEPGSGVFLPEVDYGDPDADFVYSASNFLNGNFLQTFNAPYADATFVAFFNEEITANPGDYNNDGIVDAADYTVWRNHLGEGDETNINNNGDGIDGVDVGDYALWKQHYGDTAPMNLGSGGIAGAVVPEPASVTLLLLAVCSTLSGAIGRRGRFAGE